MDVKGGQRHAQDLLQVNNLFVCLFVNPNPNPNPSLIPGVIGRMYSANWGDIVLNSERNGPGSLCISSGEGHGCEY